MKERNVYIIAGPNGSGKTTFAKEFLPDYAKCTNFVNADLIASGLSPFSPEAVALKAGKLVLRQIRDFADKKLDFAFETTLSGRTYINIIKDLKKKGYKVHIFFLWIPNVSLAIERIKVRVKEGGHDVPAIDVKRRFLRSMHNFLEVYKKYMDSWMLFDNSGTKPELIARFNNQKLEITNEKIYKKFIGGI